MYLTKNMLIRFAFPEQLIRIERILWIDSTGSEVITIDISDPSALPISRSTQEIFDAFDDKNATILTQDPFSVIYQEDKIPETWRQKRDKAWNLIEPLFVIDITVLFNPNIRGKLIDELSKATGRRKATIYSNLRRWWQGGQVINALLPHYNKCGNPGEEKKSTGNKLGRKNIFGKNNPDSIGCNVDKDMRAKIFIGAGTFFETQKKSLRQAWRLTNKQFYMIKTTTQDKVVLKLGEKYPSYDQFKYWYYKQRDYKESILRREGERKTNLKYRPLSGRSSDISFGPGSIFQIDATMGDVNLVSVFNRLRLIGRPIVYLVVDVFSHLIVGFYVGIENMSKTPYYKPFAFTRGYSVRNFHLLKNSSLKYCSLCAKEDKSLFGEPYWHRKHHPPGVLTCVSHGVYLEDTGIPLFGKNKIAITLSNYLKHHPLKAAMYIEPTNNSQKIALDIAIDSHWLLRNPISQGDYLLLKDDLKDYLKIVKNFTNFPLTTAFNEYYSDEILHQLGCSLRKTRRCDSWIHELTQLNQSCLLIPLHYLLALRFLGFSAESFFRPNDLKTPFGKGPWPCLNSSEKHYGQNTIERVFWDRKKQDPVGHFKCPLCGFAYKHLASNPKHIISGSRLLKNMPNNTTSAV